MKIISTLPLAGVTHYLNEVSTDPLSPYTVLEFVADDALTHVENAKALFEATEVASSESSKPLVVIINFDPKFLSFLDAHGVKVSFATFDETTKYAYLANRAGVDQSKRDLLDSNWTRYHTYVHNAAFGATHMDVYHLKPNEYFSQWLAKAIDQLGETSWPTKFKDLDREIPSGK